jgi:hypothetical protein
VPTPRQCLQRCIGGDIGTLPGAPTTVVAEENSQNKSTGSCWVSRSRFCAPMTLACIAVDTSSEDNAAAVPLTIAAAA